MKKFLTEEQRGRGEKFLSFTPGRFVLSVKEVVVPEGGYCPFYWYVGLGARKPVGFLGPANLLVGRVENQRRQ